MTDTPQFPNSNYTHGSTNLKCEMAYRGGPHIPYMAIGPT